MINISDLLNNPEEIQEQKSTKEFLETQAKNFNEIEGNLKYVDCPKCKNKGYIEVVKFNELYNDYIECMTVCECMKRRKTISRAHRSGLGDYLSKRFKDYETTSEWQASVKTKAIEYCKEDNKYWFVTLGQSGAGKTLISSIIANYLLLQKEKIVIYITWTDFISKLKRDLMSEQAEQVSAYLDELKNVEVLYIDELLKKYNETDLKYIIEIINYRYTNNLVTIISSEKTIVELLEIDEATFSRVVEKADKYITNIPKDKSKNYRLRGIL